MPRFGATREPFRQSIRPAAQAAAQSASARIETAKPAAAAASEKPVVNAAKPAEQTPAAAEQKSSSERGGKLLERCASGMSRLLGERRKGARGIPQFSKPLVQGELSLDSVKVMRNDLCDSDLEVVPVKAAPAPVEKAPMTVVAMAARESAWGKVSQRLFGAGKS